MTTLNKSVSRRRFMGGMAAVLGYAGMRSNVDLLAQPLPPGRGAGRGASPENYDSLVKLCFNENNFGPPESVMQAMTGALKYANRYGNPDGGILQAIADHHGVSTENVLLGAGSGEILDVMASTFVTDGKKIIGVEPTFDTVYSYATGLHGGAIKLPLLPDYRQDIPAMIKTTKDNVANVAFVYLCNPNNPTGAIVTKTEIADLLNGIPENVPVLIDEAYHHFVDDPAYASSVSYVQQGRPVVVARTFSKIAALAGMRLGYCIAPTPIIQKMRPHSVGSINAVVKWGGAAALKDTAAMEQVRTTIIGSRKKTIAELQDYGYNVIPSQGNFFMVNLRRPIGPVSQEFSQRGILVGRPFPPMTEFLRVSIGTPEDMDKFTAAFKEILPSAKRA
jgi:histidinol-phosphate aminotransferase